MKTAYSTYSSQNWEAFRTWCATARPRKSVLSASDFCEFAYQAMRMAIDEVPKESYLGLLHELTTLFLWKYQEIHHYFLAPGVADFCISSVKELTPEFCKRLPICPAIAGSPASHMLIYTFVNHMPGGFAVHFPASEQKRSIIAMPQYATLRVQPSNIKDVYRFELDDKYYFAANDGKRSVMLHKNVDIPLSPDREHIGLLLFGLSLYMDAFPDAVVEAGAENIHQIKHYDGSRHIVNRNEIIDEEHRHSVSPHWRRGHFRLLTSEKFVRKHGMTVYVRGTFVKGKAFDVLDDTPPTNP